MALFDFLNQEGDMHQSEINLAQRIKDVFNGNALNSAGLAIGSSSKKKVKVANTTYALVDGVLVKKTSAEVALAGTVTNAKFNVFVITVKADGTLVARMGTEGATIGAVVFPTVPKTESILGFVIINPTGTGNFVGATTDLDDGTVAPGAVYINNVGVLPARA